MADPSILDAMSEPLLGVRESIQHGMAPGQKRSRGSRSVCNSCRGRKVEGWEGDAVASGKLLRIKSIMALTGAGIDDSSASLSSLEGEDGRVGEDRDGGLSYEASRDEARDEC